MPARISLINLILWSFAFNCLSSKVSPRLLDNKMRWALTFGEQNNLTCLPKGWEEWPRPEQQALPGGEITMSKEIHFKIERKFYSRTKNNRPTKTAVPRSLYRRPRQSTSSMGPMITKKEKGTESTSLWASTRIRSPWENILPGKRTNLTWSLWSPLSWTVASPCCSASMTFYRSLRRLRSWRNICQFLKFSWSSNPEIKCTIHTTIGEEM